MFCPFCHGSDTRVIDSRYLQENNSIKRRRKCESCSRRFTTFESVEFDLPIVVKRDGRRENYKREKVMVGLKKSCQKRPIPMAKLELIADTIERQLVELACKEIESRSIGELVMAHLRELDAVAYVRFASVYRCFKDIDEFYQNLKIEKYEEQQREEP